MQRSVNCIYEIDITHLNFLSALVKYGKYLNIKEVNGYPLPPTDMATCQKDLQRILLENDRVKFIKVEYDAAKSMLGLFPHVDMHQLLIDYADDPVRKDEDVANEAAKIIAAFCQQRKDHPANEMIESPKLPPLTLLQSLLVLQQLEKMKMVISGLVLFSKQNTLFVQLDKQNYLLQYDEKSAWYCLETIVFDLNDGFRLIENKIDNVNLYSLACNVATKKLQKFFTRWKEKNYEGDLIPFQFSGLNFTLKTHRAQLTPRSLQELNLFAKGISSTSTQAAIKFGK